MSPPIGEYASLIAGLSTFLDEVSDQGVVVVHVLTDCKPRALGATVLCVIDEIFFSCFPPRWESGETPRGDHGRVQVAWAPSAVGRAR